MTTLYDTIGIGYAARRKPDARIAHAINLALGPAESVLNVGAGTGSYEPEGRHVTALEPSAEMIAQRPKNGAKAIQGAAEDLPFEDRSFDAAMAILTIHHWSDIKAGLNEMRRVSRDRVVILTFDPEGPYFWLKDYLPEIVELDQPIMPTLEVLESILGEISITPVPVPHDCSDGFLGAYWRRPHVYLDPEARASISTFARIENVETRLMALENDVVTDAWDQKYGHLAELETLDIGYRLITARI
ncbi:MAG: class I SAM-dependent methyltransferase [Pseudomonadota bacterium]